MGREPQRGRHPKIAARVARDGGERRRLEVAETLGRAPRVLDGWTPTETHEHYDADGNLTGRTVVTRESEWDEESVGEMYALYEARLLICPDCGNLREDCEKRDVDWFPQRSFCSAMAMRTLAERMYDFKLDPKNAGKDHREFVRPDPRDGLRIWVSRHDLTPDDHFI